MKSTLIFLSFFLFSYTLQAQTEITYTDSAGVITTTIKEVRVIEKLSFINTTNLTFSDEEKAILFQGGTVSRNTRKMTQLFPPMISEVVQGFSIQNGNVEQATLKESPPAIGWYYLIFCMVLPFGFLLLSSILIPKEKTRYVLILYTIVASAVVASVFPPIGALSVFAVVVFILAFPTFLGVGVAITAVVISTNAFTLATEKDFIVQYIIFIILSCIVSYIIRQLWFKRKERKELAQATV